MRNHAEIDISPLFFSDSQSELEAFCAPSSSQLLLILKTNEIHFFVASIFAKKLFFSMFGTFQHSLTTNLAKMFNLKSLAEEFVKKSLRLEFEICPFKKIIFDNLVVKQQIEPFHLR